MAMTSRYIGAQRARLSTSGMGVSAMICAGISAMKRLPFPFSLSKRILPPSIFTIWRTMESPSPKPSCVAAFESRSNAPNTRCCSSAVMPVPVSSTVMPSIPSLYSVSNETYPFSVNLMALDSRLFPICRMRSLSVMTKASARFSTFRTSPLCMAAGANSVSSVCVRMEIRQGDRQGCSLPLSSRKKSSSMFSILRIRSEDWRMLRMYFAFFSGSCSFSISPV